MPNRYIFMTYSLITHCYIFLKVSTFIRMSGGHVSCFFVVFFSNETDHHQNKVTVGPNSQRLMSRTSKGKGYRTKTRKVMVSNNNTGKGAQITNRN